MRMMAIILGAGLCWSAPADATTVMKLDRAQMTELSDAVHVRRHDPYGGAAPGRAGDPDRARGGRVVQGKHEPGAAITLLQMGGTLGDLVQVIPAPAGSKAVKRWFCSVCFSQERFVQVGIGLGRFLVKRSGETAVVVEELTDVAFAAPGKDGVIRPGDAPEPARMPLRQLAAEVRRYAGVR